MSPGRLLLHDLTMTQRLLLRHYHTGGWGFTLCVFWGCKPERGNLHSTSESQLHMPWSTDPLLLSAFCLQRFNSSPIPIDKCLMRNSAGCCPLKYVSLLSRSVIPLVCLQSSLLCFKIHPALWINPQKRYLFQCPPSEIHMRIVE